MLTPSFAVPLLGCCMTYLDKNFGDFSLFTKCVDANSAILTTFHCLKEWESRKFASTQNAYSFFISLWGVNQMWLLSASWFAEIGIFLFWIPIPQQKCMLLFSVMTFVKLKERNSMIYKYFTYAWPRKVESVLKSSPSRLSWQRSRTILPLNLKPK